MRRKCRIVPTALDIDRFHGRVTAETWAFDEHRLDLKPITLCVRGGKQKVMELYLTCPSANLPVNVVRWANRCP